jgi:hypothetical protein
MTPAHRWRIVRNHISNINGLRPDVFNGILICRSRTADIAADHAALWPWPESFKFSERSSPVIFLNAVLKQPK